MASVNHGVQQENIKIISHQPHGTKNKHCIKLQKILENTFGLQSDPAGKVINLNNKYLTKETFKLLKKNLNFLPIPKFIKRSILNKKWGIFIQTSN